MSNIDWSEIITDLSTQQGSPVTTDPARWDFDTPGYNEIHAMWKNANFNASAIKWINYYPVEHFSQTVIDQVAESLNLNGVHRSWISRLDPGYMAPWHWDVDDNEAEYLKQGAIVRYTVIIKPFAHGHVFILGDQYFYNLQEGKIIIWDNHREWHSGINAGMEPNWMLHILGF